MAEDGELAEQGFWDKGNAQVSVCCIDGYNAGKIVYMVGKGATNIQLSIQY